MFNVFKVQYEQNSGPSIWTQEVNGRKFEDIAKEKILDIIIDNRIQMKKALELGITASDEEIIPELEMVRKYFTDEEEFKAFLDSQKMTLDYFKASIKAI